MNDAANGEATTETAPAENAAGVENRAVVIASRTLEIPAQLQWLETGSQAGAASIPALVVLHDHFGPDELTRAAAHRLNAAGYATLTPDLFAHYENYPRGEDVTDKALLEFTDSLYDTRLLADVGAALDWLAAREGVDAARLGVLGWGWGGAYALMAAAQDARVRAAVNVSGAITYPTFTAQHPGSPLNHVANIEGALLAAFPGADPFFAEIEVERLIDQIREHEIDGEVKIYDEAPSRFWREESRWTQALWHRIETFLARTLAAEAGNGR